MGVYIKGFDVPKDCAECDDDGLRGIVGCRFFSFGIGRSPFCPLTEVKKPHGRLIDADKLIHDWLERADGKPLNINDAPTLIKAEEES